MYIVFRWCYTRWEYSSRTSAQIVNYNGTRSKYDVLCSNWKSMHVSENLMVNLFKLNKKKDWIGENISLFYTCGTLTWFTFDWKLREISFMLLIGRLLPVWFGRFKRCSIADFVASVGGLLDWQHTRFLKVNLRPGTILRRYALISVLAYERNYGLGTRKHVVACKWCRENSGTVHVDTIKMVFTVMEEVNNYFYE